MELVTDGEAAGGGDGDGNEETLFLRSTCRRLLDVPLTRKV